MNCHCAPSLHQTKDRLLFVRKGDYPFCHRNWLRTNSAEDQQFITQHYFYNYCYCARQESGQLPGSKASRNRFKGRGGKRGPPRPVLVKRVS
jgi:hypothetical protein